MRWVRQELAAVGSSYLAGSGVRRKQRLTNLADADVANYTISVADGVDRTDGASGLSTCIVRCCHRHRDVGAPAADFGLPVTQRWRPPCLSFCSFFLDVAGFLLSGSCLACLYVHPFGGSFVLQIQTNALDVFLIMDGNWISF